MRQPYYHKPRTEGITLRHIFVLVLAVSVIYGMEQQQIKLEVERAMHNFELVGVTAVQLFAAGLDVVRAALKLLSKPNEPSTPVEPIVFRPNYANIYGGATILMKSAGCHGISHILSDDNDRYMYTESTSHIEFVIGLKEEIAIESISVKSMEMYSSIVKGFRVEGSFTFPQANWTELGTFKVANNFKEQNFIVSRTVLRYIKFTVLSLHGGWAYFTLTQVKVFGEGIFAHAAKATGDIETESSNVSQVQTTKQVLTANPNECPNDPKLFFVDDNTGQPEAMRENVIVSLHEKIRTLENNSKALEDVFSKLLGKYEKLQTEMERLLKSNQKSDATENHIKQNITQIGQEVRMLGLIKDFIFEGVGLALVLLVTLVFVCHMCTYLREKETQNSAESPKLKAPQMVRRISRSKTYKMERKSVEIDQSTPAAVTI